MRTLLSSLALVALGTGAGYLVGAGRTQPPPLAAAPAARAAAERPIIVADRGLSEADLRRVVQDELAAARPAPAGATAAAAPREAAGNRSAFDDGMRRVNQAIAQRRWTRDDATALGRTLDTLSSEQRTAILHSLLPALNRGEVKLTYRGELF